MCNRVAETPRMPYLYRSFPARKEPYNWWLIYGSLRKEMHKIRYLMGLRHPVWDVAYCEWSWVMSHRYCEWSWVMSHSTHAFHSGERGVCWLERWWKMCEFCDMTHAHVSYVTWLMHMWVMWHESCTFTRSDVTLSAWCRIECVHHVTCHVTYTYCMSHVTFWTSRFECGTLFCNACIIYLHNIHVSHESCHVLNVRFWMWFTFCFVWLGLDPGSPLFVETGALFVNQREWKVVAKVVEKTYSTVSR